MIHLAQHMTVYGMSLGSINSAPLTAVDFVWRLWLGIPVPLGFDQEHVMYVWFDALTNYLSGVHALVSFRRIVVRFTNLFLGCCCPCAMALAAYLFKEATGCHSAVLPRRACRALAWHYFCPNVTLDFFVPCAAPPAGQPWPVSVCRSWRLSTFVRRVPTYDILMANLFASLRYEPNMAPSADVYDAFLRHCQDAFRRLETHVSLHPYLCLNLCPNSPISAVPFVNRTRVTPWLPFGLRRCT